MPSRPAPAQQVEPGWSGQITTKVARLPQPLAPMVYSARSMPKRKEIGCSVSRDSSCVVAAGQLNSKAARRCAMVMASGCAWSMKGGPEAQPASSTIAHSPRVVEFRFITRRLLARGC